MALRHNLTWVSFFGFLVLCKCVNAQSLLMPSIEGWQPGMIIAFAVMLLILGINLFKNRQLSRKNKILHEKLVANKQDLELVKQRETETKIAAEAAARTKSQFLATMSHEIRTPMNGVLGMAELLSNENLSPEHRNYVEIILKSGESLLSIINDILDFSKIESGKLELDKYPVNLVDCAEEVLSLLSGEIEQKPLELLYEIEEGLPEIIITDGLRLRQILLNLAGNALKFTEEGEICISMSRGYASDDQHVCINFAVSDTGIGIEKNKQANLFESFTQADATTARKYGGTGLGLTISSRLVQLMGGELQLKSNPGQGSVFYFSLEMEIEESTTRVASPHLEGRRILLLDTNDHHSGLIQQHLRHENVVLDIELVAADQVNYPANIHEYDLILFNMMCEAKGLIGHTANLKKRVPHVKTLYFSPLYAFRQIKSFSLFDEVLPKPVKRKDLLKALGQLWRAEDKPLHIPGRGTVQPQLASADFRILLAEDNPVNQKLALRTIDKLGYQADLAQNGKEVLECFAQKTYDLILMDVQMPELDGLEATRRIRKDISADAQPYILALTANAMKGDREMCLDAGMDDYMTKPFKKDQLKEKLDQISRLVLEKHYSIQ